MQSFYFSQAVHHGLPKLAHIHLHTYGCVWYLMHKVAVCPPSGLPLHFDLNESLFHLEIFRMKQIVNCAGIVSHRIIEILVLLVRFLKVTEQRGQFFAEVRCKSLNLFKDLLSNKISMSNFQRYHGQRESTCKHYLRCFRINQNVELCSRTPIAESDGSSHNRYSFYFLFYIWERFQNDRQISHGSCNYEFDATLLLYDSVINLQKWPLSNSRMW